MAKEKTTNPSGPSFAVIIPEYENPYAIYTPPSYDTEIVPLMDTKRDPKLDS